MNFPWKKRDDLIVQPHDVGGWLIKDPVTLQFTLLSSVEFQIFQRLGSATGPRNLIPEAYRKQFSLQDLEAFVQRLIARQLLYRPDGDSDRLSPRRKSGGSLFQYAGRLLSWYVPLANPRRLLQSLSAVGKIAFSRPVKIAAMAMMVAALAVIVLRFDDLSSAVIQLGQSMTYVDLLTTIIILVLVKVAHEIGHGLTATHYGADCHEAGVLFLLGTPVPFTNVTDTWTLPARQRMVVSAAGIMVELVISAGCLLLWAMASEGTTKTLLLQTAIICSVNTVLFNGNPLLRFDGYFLLSDWLGIPNLASRSFALLRSWVVRLITGRGRTVEVQDRKILAAYGLMAVIYRVVLTFGILELVHHLASDRQLESAGWVMKLFVVVALIGLPVLRMLGELFAELTSAASPDSLAQTDSTVQHHQTEHVSRANWIRPSITGTLILVAVAAVSFVPLPSRCISLASVTAAEQKLFAAASGRLVLTDDAQSSERSVDRFRLSNPEDDLRLLRLKAEEELAVVQLRIAERTPLKSQVSVSEQKEVLAAIRRRVTELEATIDERRQLLPGNVDQIVPFRKPRPEADQLQEADWTETPLALRNEGAWIEEGTLLGFASGSRSRQVTAWVSEQAVKGLKQGQPARFRLQCGSAKSVRCTVKEIGRFPVKLLPDTVAALGAIAGEPMEFGFQPQDQFYAVTLEAAGDVSTGSLPLNAVGVAAIQTDARSLAARFYQYLRRTFVFVGR